MSISHASFHSEILEVRHLGVVVSLLCGADLLPGVCLVLPDDGVGVPDERLSLLDAGGREVHFLAVVDRLSQVRVALLERTQNLLVFLPHCQSCY